MKKQVSKEGLAVDMGRRFHQLMMHYDWPQNEIADALEVSQTKISSVIVGKSAITVWMLLLLWAKYSINPIWLLLGEGEIVYAGPPVNAETLNGFYESLPPGFLGLLVKALGDKAAN